MNAEGDEFIPRHVEMLSTVIHRHRVHVLAIAGKQFVSDMAHRGNSHGRIATILSLRG